MVNFLLSHKKLLSFLIIFVSFFACLGFASESSYAASAEENWQNLINSADVIEGSDSLVCVERIGHVSKSAYLYHAESIVDYRGFRIAEVLYDDITGKKYYLKSNLEGTRVGQILDSGVNYAYSECYCRVGDSDSNTVTGDFTYDTLTGWPIYVQSMTSAEWDARKQTDWTNVDDVAVSDAPSVQRRERANPSNAACLGGQFYKEVDEQGRSLCNDMFIDTRGEYDNLDDLTTLPAYRKTIQDDIDREKPIQWRSDSVQDWTYRATGITENSEAGGYKVKNGLIDEVGQSRQNKLNEKSQERYASASWYIDDDSVLCGVGTIREMNDLGTKLFGYQDYRYLREKCSSSQNKLPTAVNLSGCTDDADEYLRMHPPYGTNEWRTWLNSDCTKKVLQNDGISTNQAYYSTTGDHWFYHSVRSPACLMEGSAKDSKGCSVSPKGYLNVWEVSAWPDVAIPAEGSTEGIDYSYDELGYPRTTRIRTPYSVDYIDLGFDSNDTKKIRPAYNDLENHLRDAGSNLPGTSNYDPSKESYVNPNYREVRASPYSGYSRAATSNKNPNPVPVNPLGRRAQQEKEVSCTGFVAWFSCMAVDVSGNFIVNFFSGFIEDYLRIDPQTFKSQYPGSQGYMIKEMWSIFRNFANLGLVILLLAVILSQITGIGISNYGVKKLLPKISAMAVVVNLSYFLSQGAIDLSNMVGGSIGNIFERLLSLKYPDPGVSMNFPTGSVLIVAIIVGFVSFLIVKIKLLGAKIMLAALMLLAVVLAGVLTLWLIAMIRQALCIMLVIVAPVAIMCYMLPGTKKIFDKWFDMFKGVLIAYPLSTLLVYGGNYIATIMYGVYTDDGNSTGGVILYTLKGLSYLIITVVPYFFLPGIILKSLGSLGGVVSSIRRGATSLGKSAIGGTRMAEKLRRQSQRNKALSAAGKKIGKDGSLIDRGTRSVRKDGRVYNIKPGQRLQKTVDKDGNKSWEVVDARIAPTFKQNRYDNMVERRNRRNAHYLPGAISAQSQQRRANRFKDYNKQQQGKKDAADAAEKAIRDINVARAAKGKGEIGRFRRGRINRKFARDLKYDAEYNAIQKEAEAAEKALLNSVYKKQNAGADPGIATTANAIIAMLRSGKINGPQLSVWIDEIIDTEQGRAALLSIVQGISPDMPDSVIEDFVACFSDSQLALIKKKNPYLHDIISRLQKAGGSPRSVGDLSQDQTYSLPRSLILGMSDYDFAKMDPQAQVRCVQQLEQFLQNGLGDNLTGANALENDELIVTVTRMAETVLSDPRLRKGLSASQIANLERVLSLRSHAIDLATAQQEAGDRAALTQGAGLNKYTGSGDVNGYVEAFKNQVENVMNKGAGDISGAGGTFGNYAKARSEGDTVRCDSILRSINKELDHGLRAAGLTGRELESKRHEVMQQITEALHKPLNGEAAEKEIYALRNTMKDEHASQADKDAAKARLDGYNKSRAFSKLAQNRVASWIRNDG